MESSIQNKVNEIDRIIRQHEWFDFHVMEFDGSSLIICGGIDLTNYHELEIAFEGVFFASIYFDGWKSDTKHIVFELPKNDSIKELNLKFQIEQGYQLFIIHPEDYKNSIYIAAKSLSYKTNKVYYYDKQDLKEGESVADFVRKNK